MLCSKIRPIKPSSQTRQTQRRAFSYQKAFLKQQKKTRFEPANAISPLKCGQHHAIITELSPEHHSSVLTASSPRRSRFRSAECRILICLVHMSRASCSRRESWRWPSQTQLLCLVLKPTSLSAVPFQRLSFICCTRGLCHLIREWFR